MLLLSLLLLLLLLLLLMLLFIVVVVIFIIIIIISASFCGADHDGHVIPTDHIALATHGVHGENYNLSF